eukprot:SAG31_NODE_212_length_20157_cov_9.648868_19_plen_178_part_00
MGPREDVCEHTHRIECAHTHECVNTHRPDERLFSSAVGRRPGRNRPGRNPTEREGSTPNPSRPSSPWKARNASSLFLGASRRKVSASRAHHVASRLAGGRGRYLRGGQRYLPRLRRSAGAGGYRTADAGNRPSTGSAGARRTEATSARPWRTPATSRALGRLASRASSSSTWTAHLD